MPAFFSQTEINVMLWKLFSEIYDTVTFSLLTVLAVVYVILFVSYFARLAIRFVNDGKYDLDYFFTNRDNWVRKATLGASGIVDDEALAALLGVALIPLAYLVLILLWPLILPVLSFYGILVGVRSLLRFRKKVEKYINNSER
jgi:hypothetical protein